MSMDKEMYCQGYLGLGTKYQGEVSVSGLDNFHGHPRYLELTDQELELHSVKNKDYTQGGDTLGNFKRVSAVLKLWGFDIPPELVALIYALKQQDAYMWMLSQGYEGKVEGVGLRLQDDYIYKKIARILHEEGG